MIEDKHSFVITNQILNDLIDIAGLAGKLAATAPEKADPERQRRNLIRSVHGSVAMDAPSLTLEQVTDILDGKETNVDPTVVQAVKNTYDVYSELENYDPYSIDDLLRAHGTLMQNLDPECGTFRSRSVAVVDENGQVLHFGTPPRYVPELVDELFDWAENSDVHTLVKSSVFHYGLELIKPFADGNGRLSRIWHALMLSRWDPAFAFLGLESSIHDHQQEYFNALDASRQIAESTPFIEFMLSSVKDSLEEADRENSKKD